MFRCWFFFFIFRAKKYVFVSYFCIAIANRATKFGCAIVFCFTFHSTIVCYNNLSSRTKIYVLRLLVCWWCLHFNNVSMCVRIWLHKYTYIPCSCVCVCRLTALECNSFFLRNPNAIFDSMAWAVWKYVWMSAYMYAVCWAPFTIAHFFRFASLVISRRHICHCIPFVWVVSAFVLHNHISYVCIIRPIYGNDSLFPCNSLSLLWFLPSAHSIL